MPQRTKPRTARRQRGFTYLWLLFIVAATSAVLAAAGTQVRTASQREREAELEFRGRAIARAIAAYRLSGGDAAGALPTALEALLDDRRQPRPQRHLRRLYADPFTGRPDWVLLLDESGGIYGVHSRSAARALHNAGLPPHEDGSPALVSDRDFDARAVPASAPASTPGSAIAPETTRPPAPGAQTGPSSPVGSAPGGPT